MTPEARIKLHEVLAGVWAVLALGTTGWALYDNENKFLLAWVIFMSAYANVVGHWSAREGAAPSAEEGT